MMINKRLIGAVRESKKYIVATRYFPESRCSITMFMPAAVPSIWSLTTTSLKFAIAEKGEWRAAARTRSTTWNQEIWRSVGRIKGAIAATSRSAITMG